MHLMMNDVWRYHCYGYTLSQPKVNNYKLCIQSVARLGPPYSCKWVGLEAINEERTMNARNQGAF